MNTIIRAQLFEYSNIPNIRGNTVEDHFEENWRLPLKISFISLFWESE